MKFITLQGLSFLIQKMHLKICCLYSIYHDLQESAIFLSKLLLPQTFEKLTMQDLRALIAERSEMTIYIRGETIEIPYHSVAFLLEGYIKTQGSQELATAPAALVPLHGNRSFQNLSTSGIACL
jgi:hypothetical protein